MSGLIVHEWLEQRGGAERVIDSMRATFPEADLIALWNDAPEKYPDAQETWVARTPLRRHKALALPILPLVWRNVRPYKYSSSHEWILISSHLFAHHVKPYGADRDVPKFVYAHTPARYLWTPELDQRGDSAMVKAAAGLLKPLDKRRAQEPAKIASNSEYIRRRIQDTWGRDSTVIYPPVDVERIQSVSNWSTQLSESELERLEALPEEFILGASRFVPYKRLDRVIVTGEANDVPVVIAGSGSEEDYLRALGERMSVPVHFIESPSNQLLFALYQRAKVFVFPAIEDFGIMPVEAQAAGTPVVTTSLGGATESCIPGVSGRAAFDDSQAGIDEAVAEVLSSSNFEVPKEAVSRFSQQTFRQNLRDWMAGHDADY
ncbi:glycosyltransferase [Corynebacterium flavescens]|uniref:glycosyltransferase n=1 Tax=Corynebacterium flavescens TaxID=28028 RepID=UPI003FD5B609